MEELRSENIGTHVSYFTALMDDSLYKAAEEGKANVFFQVNENYPLDRLLTPYNNSILHIHLASQGKKPASIHFVKDILNLCPDLLWKLNNNNESLLHLAARYGQDNIVRLLIEKMREAPDRLLVIENKEKETPLHEAVRFKHVEVVKILIQEDIDGLQGLNEIGETPFYLAVERKYGDIVQVMIESSICKKAYHGPAGRTALHAAVLSYNLELTRVLLSWECALNEKYDDEGWYPIHYAADYGYASIVEALLDTDKSAAYYVTKREKKTALHIAARCGHVNVMIEIVSRCPCSAELVDARNRNVVHFVMESQKRAAVLFVLKTPSLRKLVNEFNGVGNAPIHQLAISLGPPTTMNTFMKHPEVDAHKFNKINCNALDLIAKFRKHNFMQSSGIKSQWEQLGFQRGRRIAEVDEEETFKEEDGDDSKKRKSNDDVLNYIRKEREGYLVAAALIATVAFAAGLAVPGGFKENKASPILLQNAAFKTFIVTNYVSQILSTVAVLLHLHTTFIEKHQAWIIVLCFRFQLGATFYALFFMLIAFISGTYAILTPSRTLNIALCVLAIVFFHY